MTIIIIYNKLIGRKHYIVCGPGFVYPIVSLDLSFWSKSRLSLKGNLYLYQHFITKWKTEKKSEKYQKGHKKLTRSIYVTYIQHKQGKRSNFYLNLFIYRKAVQPLNYPTTRLQINCISLVNNVSPFYYLTTLNKKEKSYVNFQNLFKIL